MNVLDLACGERIRWKRLADPWSPELLRARYRHQTFGRHSHDRFALGVIEAGGLAFQYRGQQVIAPQGWVNLAHPGEVHTGQPAGPEGWGYRMFYLDPAALLEAAKSLGWKSNALPFIDAGALSDPDLAGRIATLHRVCEDPHSEPLERQVGLVRVLQLLLVRHGGLRSGPPRLFHRTQRIKDYLHAHWNRAVSLQELSQWVGLNPCSLTRSFTREVGIPPHAYLIQLRLHQAASLLRRGVAPAEVAMASGFADQSHLHRHFVKWHGLTPGDFRNPGEFPA